jgi:hypothetical protein
VFPGKTTLDPSVPPPPDPPEVPAIKYGGFNVCIDPEPPPADVNVVIPVPEI